MYVEKSISTGNGLEPFRLAPEILKWLDRKGERSH